jgi:hypothetical protein
MMARMRKPVDRTYSVSSVAIPAEVAGKTFEYVDGSYVLSDRTGAPANGVRFLIYGVNPITLQPVLPLQEVGYVELTDVSGSITQGVRVVVVSAETTYIDYTVTAAAGVSGGQMTVAGFVTDGNNRANINLRATVTESAGMTLLYTLDVPQRDFSIELTMTMSGLDPQSGTTSIALSMNGPNGSLSMSGQLAGTGGTLTVEVNGNSFATITSTGTGEAVITGANGQPISGEDASALQNIFGVTADAFIAFDQMTLPIGGFLAPAA